MRLDEVAWPFNSLMAVDVISLYLFSPVLLWCAGLELCPLALWFFSSSHSTPIARPHLSSASLISDLK